MIKKLKQLAYVIKRAYWRYCCSSVKEARSLGIKVGENCFIASRLWPTEPYLIEIGSNVQITRGVMLHTHGGAMVARQKFPDFDVFGKIKIGNWVYIGSNSQIMPGVTIGDGALISAGSIVTKSIPANEVWGGVPAKFICKVEDYIKHNSQYNLNSKYMTRAEKKKFLMSLPDDKFIKK